MSTQPSIRIRTFRISDYEKAYRIWVSSEGVGLNASDSRKAIGQYLRRNPGLSMVAVSANRVVGTVLCGHDGRRGFLNHLAVARKWRGRGIGKALVEASLDGLRREGIPKCNLMFFTTNKAGRAFWKRMGWNIRNDLRLAQRNNAS
jgi:ribosomal protein S18 acetylase RimI-like enzyme